MSKRYLITAAIAAAAVAVTLSACSSSGSLPSHSSMSRSTSMSGMASGSAAVQAGAPASGPHNAADVAFATDMIPHHAQALEMAKMALTKARSPKVKQLAQMIESEQTPEISTMSGWLKGWNKPVPDTSAGGMHMGGMSMPGMMSDADMAKLDSATGPAFDELFLTEMITHHTGALSMANTELSDGQNGDAKTLAKSIIAGQSKEITQMKVFQPTVK
jgi:uncharacterized protein (DUF305 family)